MSGTPIGRVVSTLVSWTRVRVCAAWPSDIGGVASVGVGGELGRAVASDIGCRCGETAGGSSRRVTEIVGLTGTGSAAGASVVSEKDSGSAMMMPPLTVASRETICAEQNGGKTILPPGPTIRQRPIFVLGQSRISL